MFMRKTILDNLLIIPFDANNNYEHLSIDKVQMFIILVINFLDRYLMFLYNIKDYYSDISWVITVLVTENFSELIRLTMHWKFLKKIKHSS